MSKEVPSEPYPIYDTPESFSARVDEIREISARYTKNMTEWIAEQREEKHRLLMRKIKRFGIPEKPMQAFTTEHFDKLGKMYEDPEENEKIDQAIYETILEFNRPYWLITLFSCAGHPPFVGNPYITFVTPIENTKRLKSLIKKFTSARWITYDDRFEQYGLGELTAYWKIKNVKQQDKFLKQIEKLAIECNDIP